MARSPNRFGACRRGFTLVELIVTLAIVAVMLLITVPGFLHIEQRRKLEGTAEQTAALLRKARYDAIRLSRPVEVALNVSQRVLFIDRDGDQTFDPEETLAGSVPLPRGVEPGGPVGDADPVDGFSDLGGALRVAVLEPTGRLRSDGGGFRLHDQRDNFLEIRVSDPATASVVLRKWQGGVWRRKGESGKEWTWNL